ncbi:MAG: helix-turn-helix transcriptional regulator [Rhodoferax sp.]
MRTMTRLDMPIPSGDQLKAARIAAGLSQVQTAEWMGYSLQSGSRGGVQSRTWQALESPTDERKMQGPVFAMSLLLTDQHPEFRLTPKSAVEADHASAAQT